MNICNPFDPSCSYWVASDGQCFGCVHLPDSSFQINADNIQRVRASDQNVAGWERFRKKNQNPAIAMIIRNPLVAECGVTGVSLQNASYLLMLYGEPMRLDFSADKYKGDYFVTGKWKNGPSWMFSGFSWGYGGTGPHGLQRFFDMIGPVLDLKADQLPLDKYGKTDATWFHPSNPERQ